MGDTWLELAAAEIHQRDLIRNAERERLIRMAKRSNRERTWWQRMLEWVRRTNA